MFNKKYQIILLGFIFFTGFAYSNESAENLKDNLIQDVQEYSNSELDNVSDNSDSEALKKEKASEVLATDSFEKDAENNIAAEVEDVTDVDINNSNVVADEDVLNTSEEGDFLIMESQIHNVIGNDGITDNLDNTTVMENSFEADEEATSDEKYPITNYFSSQYDFNEESDINNFPMLGDTPGPSQDSMAIGDDLNPIQSNIHETDSTNNLTEEASDTGDLEVEQEMTKNNIDDFYRHLSVNIAKMKKKRTSGLDIMSRGNYGYKNELSMSFKPFLSINTITSTNSANRRGYIAKNISPGSEYNGDTDETSSFSVDGSNGGFSFYFGNKKNQFITYLKGIYSARHVAVNNETIDEKYTKNNLSLIAFASWRNNSLGILSFGRIPSATRYAAGKDLFYNSVASNSGILGTINCVSSNCIETGQYIMNNAFMYTSPKFAGANVTIAYSSESYEGDRVTMLDLVNDANDFYRAHYANSAVLINNSQYNYVASGDKKFSIFSAGLFYGNKNIGLYAAASMNKWDMGELSDYDTAKGVVWEDKEYAIVEGTYVLQYQALNGLLASVTFYDLADNRNTYETEGLEVKKIIYNLAFNFGNYQFGFKAGSSEPHSTRLSNIEDFSNYRNAKEYSSQAFAINYLGFENVEFGASILSRENIAYVEKSADQYIDLKINFNF